MEDEVLKGFLGRQLDGLVDGGKTYEEAVRHLLEYTDSGMRAALIQLLEERQGRAAGWAKRIRVTDGDSATAVAGDSAAWYLPPADGGLRWGRLRAKMLESGLAGAVEAIDTSTDAIVKELAEPFSHSRRRGIVIGNVQSGKTANYAAVAAKALDAGYRFVLVLSGIHNNLRDQTQRRLNRDLCVDDHPAEWYQLTTVLSDLNPSERKNAAASVSSLTKHRKMIAVMKKNSSRLDHLIAYLDNLDDAALARTPILIIDDESDQATPDSSRGTEDDPTVINRKMRQVWSRVRNGSYVGYTATPFANVFMDPEDDASSGLESLYPRDFIHVMPTPSNYFGAERLFGIRDGGIDAEATVGADVVRRIPREEVPLLAPAGRADADEFVPTVTDSLQDAVRWFIVASAIRRMRGQKSKHSTMLIHTTHRVKPHQATRDVIQEFLEPLKDRAQEGDVEELHEIFKREEARAAHLYTGDAPAPTWPAIREQIVNVLRVLEVIVDNGDEAAADRIVYTDDQPRTAIVIGGGTLSRGLTLEGLFVSFFTRTSNAYDTLLQMGRWFGYRPGYEDLQRIWLAEGLETDYQFLAQVEAEMREEIRRMSSEGLTPGQIGVRIRQHPGRLEITSATKMKHAQQVECTFQGYRTQTTMFDFSDPAVQDSNVQTALELLADIAEHEVVRETSGSRLYTDVGFSRVKAFFDGFAMHKRHEETHREALNWAEAKLPEVPWRVVLASGGREEVFTRQGFAVKAVNRAPINELDGASLNIRALMSGSDRIADLLLAGVPEASEAKRDMDRMLLRHRAASEGGANGEGLLVLYPISRSSQAQKSSTRESHRVDMAAMLGQLLDGPVNTDLPLIGYGMVLPSDAAGELDGDGDFRSVVISGAGEDEEIDDDHRS